MTVQTSHPAVQLRSAASVELLRLALLMQGALLTVSAIESLIFGIAGGGVTVAAILTIASATLVFATRRKSERRRRLRWLIRLEYLLAATGVIDLLLAAFLAHRPLEAVGLITRLALPITVIVLARRAVRSEVTA